MTLSSSPIFWVIVVIVFGCAFVIGRKIGEKKVNTNPYFDKNIKEVMDNPELLKEKIKNVEVVLSDGKEHKINKIVDAGKEIQL